MGLCESWFIGRNGVYGAVIIRHRIGCYVVTGYFLYYISGVAVVWE